MRSGYAVKMMSSVGHGAVYRVETGNASARVRWAKDPVDATLYGDPYSAVAQALRCGGWVPVEVVKVEYGNNNTRTKTVWASIDARMSEDGTVFRDGAWIAGPEELHEG